MRRRDFVRSSAALAAGLSVLPLGAHGWAASGGAAAPPRLVVVLLRGAVDGLNVVVPYADPDYRNARPTLAISPPGRDGGVIELDGRFGLHPALAPLLPL
ncbi:MAG: hypothetical protein ACREFQ_16285, partial [Stellaceae bacterium]